MGVVRVSFPDVFASLALINVSHRGIAANGPRRGIGEIGEINKNRPSFDFFLKMELWTSR